ncbi:hypothetical protein AGMMS50222_08210 [Endomicrobiia bacterium]|nr:hypothetical protein AGMMS49556_08900 [Endomicrobiia bacterium]GHT76111.1 hypothetical protein AGMMS50222_08210 [Endomicrobiia bacterium]
MIDNHNHEVKPEYKSREQIENEVYEILHYYQPDYLNDLSVNIEPYEFIMVFLPEYIRKTESRQLEVAFETLDEDLAGYTQYDKVVLNRTKYDSKNVIDQRMMNFTILHEACHALSHFEYLRPSSQSSLAQHFKQDSKLDKIITLRRDLQTSKETNPLCAQANYFAACFTIPRDRLIKALLEVFGKSCIEIEDNLDFYDDIIKIAKGVQRFFDMNLEPIKIALEQYGLVKTNDLALDIDELLFLNRVR